MKRNWCMTKWCKIITDDEKDVYMKNKSPKEFTNKFRILDDDGQVYGYGFSKEIDFEPLYYYEGSLGVARIEYRNQDGVYELI